MAFDDASGFWLIHSVPRFPRIEDTYEYPKTGLKYGQSFLCISFKTSSLDDIGLIKQTSSFNNLFWQHFFDNQRYLGIQLIFGQPSFYAKHIPRSFRQQFPNLAEALLGVKDRKSPTSSTKKLRSRKGQNFISFYKNDKFGRGEIKYHLIK